MRYMIIVKATQDSEAGVMPPDSLVAEMGAFHETLMRAGVLVDGSGLQPSSKGWRIDYEGEERTVTDGPFAETKELLAGYTIINVESEEDARRWSREFPNPSIDGGTAQIEVRRFYELEDFEPSDAIEHHKKLQDILNDKA